MYIVAIGWLYVTLLVAANEASVVAGVISFLFYGLMPCALLLWMGDSKVRRQRRRHQELLADQRLRNGDGSDTQPDQ
jgi:sulfite exporter TauE/SafE